MNPDFMLKNNDGFDDDLPKPANMNNNELTNEPVEPIEEVVSVVEPEQVIPRDVEEEINTTFKEMEIVSDPLPSGEDVFGFNQEVEEPSEIFKSSVVNTPEPEPVIINNEEQPKEKKSRGGLVTIIIVILILIGVSFALIKVLSIGTAPKPGNPNDKIEDEKEVIDPIKDEVVYKDKIINDVLKKVEIFNSGSESLMLYMNQDNNLVVTISGAHVDLTEVEGLSVTNFANIKVKTMFAAPGCTILDTLTYVLMEDGSLYALDYTKGYADVFTKIKETPDLKTIEVNLTRVASGSLIDAFTTIKEGKTACATKGVYVLTKGNKPEVRIIDHKRNNIIAIGERYRGHVNSLVTDNVDYLIYADKTVSDINNKVLVDSNNQNYKFEKVIYGNGDIKELNANYVFIGTDNKLYYSLKTKPQELKTNDKVVTEVSLTDVTNTDETTSKGILIKYADETEETLTIEHEDLNLINIQDLIDNPIN